MKLEPSEAPVVFDNENLVMYFDREILEFWSKFPEEIRPMLRKKAA